MKLTYASFLAFLALLFCTAGQASAADVKVSSAMTLTNGTYANNYIFTGQSGVLTMATNGAGDVKVNSLSTEAGGYGQILVPGTTTTSAYSVRATQDMSQFVGKITIGSTKNSTAAASYGWFIIDETDKSTGSAGAEFTFNTRTNQGVVIRKNTSGGSTIYTIGAMNGSGGLRFERFKNDVFPELHVGALRTSSSDVDLFHGFVSLSDSNPADLYKEGAGTWILTELNHVNNYSMNLRSLTINGGTVQIGDYGYVYGEGDLHYAAGTVGTGTQSSIIISSKIPITINEGGALIFARSIVLDPRNKITIDGGALGTLNNSLTQVYKGNITAKNLHVRGTGTIRFEEQADVASTPNVDESTKQTFTGTVTLQGGFLYISDRAKEIDNCPIQFDGGGLKWQGNVIPADLFTVTENGGTYDYRDAANQLKGLSNAGTKGGTLTIISNTKSGDFADGLALGEFNANQSANFKNFTGTLRTEGYGVISLFTSTDFSQITFDLGQGSCIESGLYLVRCTANAQATGTQLVHKLGDLTGDGLVTMQRASFDGNVSKNFQLQIGALNNDSEFDGAFVHYKNSAWTTAGLNTVSVEKVGTGTWTLGPTENALTNVNNEMKKLTISKGAVALARNAGLVAADAVEVAAGAGLKITARGQKITNSLTLQDGASISFTLTGDQNSASLEVGGKLLNAGDFTLSLELTDDFAENLTPDAQFEILRTSSPNTDFQAKFLEAVATNPTLSYYGVPVIGTDGSISLAVNNSAVPEPATWVLLLLGAGLMSVKKRKIVINE